MKERMRRMNKMKLDMANITCKSCEEWLSKPIFLSKNEMNYCGTCAVKLGKEVTRNKALENVLEHLIYPCTICKQFNATHAVLMKHMKECEEKIIKCDCCNDLIQARSIRKHLKAKFMKFVKIRSIPSTVVKLTAPMDFAKYFLITIEKKDFLISISPAEEGLGIDISIGTYGPDAENGTTFVVTYLEQTAKGKVLFFPLMFHESGTVEEGAEARIVPPKSGNFEVTINFGKPESNINISDCLICFNPLTDKIFPCKNGHSVCSNCVEKMNSCGICRLPLGDAYIKLSSLFADYCRPCPNALFGCLRCIPPSQLEEHQIKCLYKQVSCEVCLRNESKYNIWSHMVENHSEKINLFLLKADETTYVLFNNEIFACTVTVADKVIYFIVRILYSDSKEASKYRFEIQFRKGDWTKIVPDYSIQNVVQGNSFIEAPNTVTLEYVKDMEMEIILSMA